MKMSAIYILMTCLVLSQVACETVNDEDIIVYSALYKQITTNDGTTLEFAEIYPEGLDLNKEWPVLIAFPPGNQDRSMVDWGLNTYWIDWTVQRDWIVISPVAPDGISFYNGSSVYVPELIEWIKQEYHVEGDLLHMAGVSAGGYSGFRVAIDYPEYFISLTVLPGVPPEEEDHDKLFKLEDIIVTMYVGQNDEGWVEETRTTAQELEDLGVQVTFLIFPLQGHVINSITPAMLFNLFNGFRP
jgi:dipeptidyl aminopeptidase/acylaminoacyl peptidase